MALQVNGGNPGMIGRMFARQNVTDLYSRQKSVDSAKSEKTNQAMDRVDLSPFAPRPLEASIVEDSGLTAEKINKGSKLTTEEVESLREDRVFAALTTLLAVGADPNTKLMGWPGGLPTPTQDEMHAAYRRLTQRMDRVDDTDDPDKTIRMRSETLENMRRIDTSQLSAAISDRLLAPA